MRYLELATQESHEHFIVECKWPSSEFGEPSKHIPAHQTEWGRYAPSAWNDKREPNKARDGFGHCYGSFEKANPDLQELPSRVKRRDGSLVPTFTDAADAFAYAERLAEHGECAARYGDGGTQENRDAQYAGRKIHTRVVRQVHKLTEWEVAR